MKNLLIYISKYQCFDTEGEIVIKIQIDNSLDLGWKKEDIMLVTNFPYEYNGITAIVIDNDNLCRFTRQASKINAILTLFKLGLIGDELYWFHDLDVFQMEPLSEIELDNSNIALTDYGGNDMWNTGSVFFKNGSEDMFSLIRDVVYEYKTDEERALMALTGHNVKMTSKHSIGRVIPAYSDKCFKNRIIKLNSTYNFIPRYLEESYKISEKPIKCIHFHPVKTKKWTKITQADEVINGNNPLGKPLVNERLKLIFNKHLNVL